MSRCAHAQARYTVVCLCVYVCVCLCRRLQLLRDQRSASKSFYRLLVTFFLDFNSWICKLKLGSRVMVSFAYFEGYCTLCRLVRSKIS